MVGWVAFAVEKLDCQLQVPRLYACDIERRVSVSSTDAVQKRSSIVGLRDPHTREASHSQQEGTQARPQHFHLDLYSS
jgi:hypothetical protein